MPTLEPVLKAFARRFTFAIVFIFLAKTSLPHAHAQLYWDSNDSTAGFGTAQGTWAAPTTNNSTQGWSASSAGTDVMSGTTNTTTTDALNFGTASAGLAAGTITVSGTVAANSLTFGSASGNITLSGGTITLGGTTPTITTNNTADTISSVLAGSAGLTKNGTGTLTLSGANTFTGNVVVNAGTIATSGSGTFADSVNVTVNSGGNYTVGVADTINTLSGSGVLRLNAGLTLANDSTFAGTISGSGALSVVLYKTWTFSGNNSGWSGSFNPLEGTFIAGSDYAFGTGTIVTPNGFIATFRSSNATDRYLANGLTRSNNAGNSLTFGSAGTGNLTFAGGYGSSNGQNLNTTFIINNAWTQFNGAFYSGGFLTKNGNGTLILNGNNTYGATTTINAGTLQIGASGRLGAGNYSSTIAINGLTSSFLYSGTSNQILGGVISGNGALTHNGTGTLTLTNNNTYTGATTINAGTLEIGAAGRLGAGSYAMNISNNGTFIYSGTNAQTLSGVVSGTGALTHNASSTLTLSGANTYNGATTINAGTLVVSGTNTASAITINSGGSLLSATSLGSTTVNSGGKIAPGASANSVGSLTVAGLSLNSNGTYTWDMSNATGAAGTGWDRLVSSGLLTIGATSGSKFTIAIASSGTPTNWDYTSSGQTWDIITYGSLSGFSADKFAFDTSAFGGSVTPDSSWALSDTGSALRLTYTYAATTPTWNGASGNWSTGFSPGITSGANATFAGAGGTATNNILSGNLSSVGTILFSGTGAYTLQANSGSAGYDAASAMAIGSGITNTSSGTQTIDLALSFASNQTISADSGMIVIGGPISGAGSLTKQGANALTLSGNNTYSGGTTLAAGKLNINNASALGNGTLTITSGTLDSTVSGVTLNNNAQNWNGDFSFTGTNNLNLGTGAVTMNANRTITASAGTLTVGGVVSGTGFGITKNGSGTLALNGNNTFTGATTINAGTLQIGSSARLGGGSYSGNITINGPTSALVYSGTNNQTLSGALSGNGALTKDGSSTLTLSGASKTMSGAVTINNGTVLVSGGALNADFTVNSGATLIAGAQYALANGKTITLNGGALDVGALFIETGSSSVTGIVLNNGTINGNSSGHFLAQGWVANGNNTINNRVSLENNKAGSDNFDIQSGTTTINAAVYNYASRTLGITKNGVGALVLNAANSFGGTTTLNNGTIVLNNATALGTSALTIVSGTLDNTSNATITLANNNTQSWNGNFSFGGTRDLNMGTGAVAMNASRTVTVNAGNFTVGGVISGSGFGLTKNGNGTLILTGASNYSGGTTLNAGTLVIGNTAAAGSGTITQSSTSSLLKLDTTGTIANAMSIYNVSANKTLTLSGGITVNNAVFDVASGETLTISNTINGTGGVTKNGAGNLTLSGNNTYSGATVVNSGTLEAAAPGALGSNNTIQVTGGTLLVSADNAINNKSVTLNSTSATESGLAFSGTYSGVVDNLTLSADSIIDLGGGSVSIMFKNFDYMDFVAKNLTLDIYNWTGTTLWNGGTGNDTDKVYFGPDLSDDALAKIRFHSGAVGAGDSFLGSGFELMPQTTFEGNLGYQIIPVPEPETYATGLLLLLGGAWWIWRKRKAA
ncbi:MAG: toxins and related Ca2+-binding domain [Verrucomicrobiota bacterium]|jgi:autotransporter-associated beta strand protein